MAKLNLKTQSLLLLFLSLFFSPILSAQVIVAVNTTGSKMQPMIHSLHRPDNLIPIADIPTDQNVIRRFSTFTPDVKRHILYLYARLNKPKIAMKLADEVLTNHPDDKESLLVLASMFLERQDPVYTQKLARKVLASFPDDHQGLFFLAASYQLMGRHQEAESIFSDLEKKQFKKKEFPYKIDFASSAYQAGDWRKAMRAYQSILDDAQISPQLHQEARRVLDELYRTNLPQTLLQWDWTEFANGAITRSSAEYQYPLTNRHRLYVDWKYDYLSLDAEPGNAGTYDDRVQGVISLETFHNPDWRTKIGIGGSESGPVVKARATHILEKQRECFITLDYNERALDSLSLELLDGREDKISFGLDYLLTQDTTLRWEGNLRQVHIDDQLYGHGFGFDLAVDHILLRRPFDFIIGYEANVMLFSHLETNDTSLVDPIALPGALPSQSRSLLENLVSSEINRHTMNFTIRGEFTRQWHYEISANAGYSFENEQEVYGFRFHTHYFFTKSVELRLDAGYDSSGSDSNSGSVSNDFAVSLKAYF